MRRRNTVLTMSLLLMAGLWYVFLGPRQLGGPVTYVVTSGNSMEPRIGNGDLVLTRAKTDYRVGDVVAYNSPEIKKTVLHRIVEVDGEHFVLQGDNNDWLDKHRPTAGEIYGEEWVHVAGAGKLIDWMRSPIVLVAVAALIAAGIIGSKNPQLRHRSARAGPRGSRSRSPGPPPREPTRRGTGVVARLANGIATERPAQVAIAVALGCFVVGGVAFTTPATRPTQHDVQYRHTGQFRYSAPAPEGPVYEGAVVSTGDTVFLELVDRVDVEFSYEFKGEGDEIEVTGAGALHADLSDKFGWERSFDLVAQTGFAGKAVTLKGELDVGAIRGLIADVETRTKSVPGQYTLVLRPDVQVEGGVAGEEISDSFSPTLAFSLDDLRLRLDDRNPDFGTALEPSEPGDVSVRVDRSNSMPLPLLSPNVAATRAASLLGAVLALAFGLYAGLRSVPPGPAGKLERLKVRYRRYLLPVSSLEVDEDRAVRFSTFEGLTQLADRFETPILHHRHGPRETFAIKDGDAWYVYTAGGSGAVVDPASTPEESDPLDPPEWLQTGSEREPTFTAGASPPATSPPATPPPATTPGAASPPAPRLPADEERKVRDAASMGTSRLEAMMARASVEATLRHLHAKYAPGRSAAESERGASTPPRNQSSAFSRRAEAPRIRP